MATPVTGAAPVPSRPAIKVRGRPVGEGRTPLVIVPLVGRTGEAVLAELGEVLPKKPDIVEWRADFFGEIGVPGAALELARRLKALLGATPLLFTVRSAKEGGQETALGEDGVVALHAALCRSGLADIVDYELGAADQRLRQVRSASRASGVTMIMSYHNFHATPSLEVLSEKFMQAEALGADVAKVAVMPASPDDVLVLLKATLNAAERQQIPLISMSMGGLGALSRLIGWAFGSAATFAVGAGSSAPGQIPVEELRVAVRIARDAMGASR
jgi:3-dehydroquinate dehydratase I